MTRKDMAAELYAQGFICSQAVFAVFAEKYGLSREMALRIGCGFGGGMRNAEACGAVTGGIMVISLRYGHIAGGDSESKLLCFQKTREFTDRFAAKNGSIVCRDLLGIDIFKGDGMQIAAGKNLFKTTCVDMIRDAVEILEELGY